MQDSIFGRTAFFKNGIIFLPATASDQRRLKLDHIVKRVRRAIDAAVRLPRKKPEAFPLVKCVTALADDIGHGPSSNHIDLKFHMLVGL